MLQVVRKEDIVPGKPTEFSRLFDEHHGMVFRTAYRITGNAADAEDVLQTIFLRLIRRPPTDVLDSEESYLRRAAVNVSLDVIRAKQANTAIPLSEASGAARAEGNTSDIRDCLRRAFARLTPRSAEIFALRYLEGLSNQQIARMLDVSQVLIAVTLHRTRRQLQKEIRSYFGDKLS